MMRGARDTMLHFFLAAIILLQFQVTYSSYTCDGCETKRSDPNCDSVLSNTIPDDQLCCKEPKEPIQLINRKCYEEYPSFECTPAPKINPENRQDITTEDDEHSLQQCQPAQNIGAQESCPFTYCPTNPTPSVPSVDAEQNPDPPQSDPTPNQEGCDEASSKEMESTSIESESPGLCDMTRPFQQHDSATSPMIMDMGSMEDEESPQCSLKMESSSVQNENTDLNSLPLGSVNEVARCSLSSLPVTLGDAPPLYPMKGFSDTLSQTTPVSPDPTETIEDLSCTKPTVVCKSKFWIMPTDQSGSESQSSTISTISPMGSIPSSPVGMVESVKSLLPTSESYKDVDSSIEGEKPQLNSTPSPLVMEGVNLGSISLPMATICSEEQSTSNPRPEIQMCSIDQTSTNPPPNVFSYHDSSSKLSPAITMIKSQLNSTPSPLVMEGMNLGSISLPMATICSEEQSTSNPRSEIQMCSLDQTSTNPPPNVFSFHDSSSKLSPAITMIKSQLNSTPRPLVMEGVNLGSISLPMATICSEEQSTSNPRPEIQMCSIDQTSTNPPPNVFSYHDSSSKLSPALTMIKNTPLSDPIPPSSIPPSCQLISIPSLSFSPKSCPCSSNILPPNMYGPLPSKETSNTVGCTLFAEKPKIGQFSCTPVSTTYSGCKNSPTYSVCRQPSTCTWSTSKPIYEEVIHHVPVLKKVIRNRMVEMTRHVPILEKHIVHEKTQMIRHVPVIQKVRRNVIEYNTKHVPVIRHRTRTVQDSYTDHVPNVQKFTRPVVETIVKQVPMVYKRYKPVLNTRIKHVPFVETRFTPVVDETITTVPVRRRVIKNIVEEKIRPVFRPCPKNSPESSTFHPKNNWCCWS